MSTRLLVWSSLGFMCALAGCATVPQGTAQIVTNNPNGQPGIYRSEDMDTVRRYREAAEQGDASAQANLGTLYANGRGVARDDAAAVHWYRKAAEQGDAVAQSLLGMTYANGRGVAQDDAAAVRWFRQSAEQGHAVAQDLLGFMYANGRGVARDDAEAVRWYRQAAKQGDAIAQDHLAAMYANGRGVARDGAATSVQSRSFNEILAENRFKMCKSKSGFAQITMENRQAGVPKNIPMEYANKVDNLGFAQLVIIEAYKNPQYETNEKKRQAIEDFRDKIYSECLASRGLQ